MSKLRCLALGVVLLCFALAGCGRSFELLLPGQGPGSYSGSFGGGASGVFDLRVRDSGQFSGSGTLGGFEVELRGVLKADGSAEGFITERTSQRSGRFDGSRSATQLSGDWRLDPTGQQTWSGTWDAVMN